jgi:hypothetical protein
MILFIQNMINTTEIVQRHTKIGILPRVFQGVRAMHGKPCLFHDEVVFFIIR